ncbi:MAG TPA: hypothetical protein VF120_08790 [Ktedonobacterales bacterium]
MDQPRYPQSASRSGPLLATPSATPSAAPSTTDSAIAPGYNASGRNASGRNASGYQPPAAMSGARLRLVTAEGAVSATASAPATRWGPTSIGLSATLAAGLGYLIGPLGVFFYFAEKRNRFLRFHCAQVILLAIVAVLLGATWSTVIALEGMLGTTSSSTLAALVLGVSACAFGLAYLGLFGAWLWGLISGFTGKYTKLPLIGNIAERWAGGPPSPVF